MPKKTKKAKLAADYRRKKLVQPTVSSSGGSSQTKEVSTQIRYALPTNISHTILTDERDELRYIRKDVTKTIVLALIAITVELLLYIKLS